MAVLRDISLILLVAEAFVLVLAPLVLFGGLVYGLGWLRRGENLPRWLRVVRTVVERGQHYVNLGAGGVTKPFLLLEGYSRSVQLWWDDVTARLTAGSAEETENVRQVSDGRS